MEVRRKAEVIRLTEIVALDIQIVEGIDDSSAGNNIYSEALLLLSSVKQRGYG